MLGGNFYESKPEAGIYDASYGVMLKGEGKGNFKAIKGTESGLYIRDAVRDMTLIRTNNKTLLVAAKNNAQAEIKELEKN